MGYLKLKIPSQQVFQVISDRRDIMTLNIIMSQAKQQKCSHEL